MRGQNVLVSSALVAMLNVLACDDSASNICAPGATQQCLCLGARNGVQTCNAPGSGWNDCRCSSADAAILARHDRGIDNAADANRPDTGANSSTPDYACPAHADMVRIPSLNICIDRYEASRGSGNVARSVPAETPWVYVGWSDATAACAAAGKRLCSETEWYQACRGPERHPYPYGATFKVDYCNVYGHAVGVALPTGAMSQCVGGYPGVYDMVGNVWEYTSTLSAGLPRVRGGSYFAASDLPICDASSNASVEGNQIYVGFRCCLSL